MLVSQSNTRAQTQDEFTDSGYSTTPQSLTIEGCRQRTGSDRLHGALTRLPYLFRGGADKTAHAVKRNSRETLGMNDTAECSDPKSYDFGYTHTRTSLS